MDALVAIGSTASFIYGCISIFKMAYGFGYNDLNLVQSLKEKQVMQLQN